jgi:hypothetical protein
MTAAAEEEDGDVCGRLEGRENLVVRVGRAEEITLDTVIVVLRVVVEVIVVSSDGASSGSSSSLLWRFCNAGYARATGSGGVRVIGTMTTAGVDSDGMAGGEGMLMGSGVWLEFKIVGVDAEEGGGEEVRGAIGASEEGLMMLEVMFGYTHRLWLAKL